MSAWGVSFEVWMTAFLVMLLTTVIRVVTAQFPIDHFVHLTGAFMVTRGELPWRDFLDAGRPFQYFASAVVIALSGPSLLGEAVLCAGVIGIGTGVLFVVLRLLSGSRFLSLILTAVAVLAYPRLYSYPKVFFYVLAIVLVMLYLRRPGWFPAALLGLTTGAASLFRADHGVYIGLTCVVLLLALRGTGQMPSRASVLAYLGALSSLAMPFIIFVQLNGGVIEYVRLVAEYQADSRRYETIPPHLARGSLQFPPQFSFDVHAPFFGMEVMPEATRVIGVRWERGARVDDRRAAESEFGLVNGRFIGDLDWEYDTVVATSSRIRELIEDPRISSVTHVDLDAGALTGPSRQSLISRAYEALPALRLRVLPGVINAPNALPFLFYLVFLLPLAGLVITVVRMLRRGRVPHEASDLAFGASITTLCILAVVGLVRVPIVDRLPDALPMVCVLGAWLCGMLPHRGSPVGVIRKCVNVSTRVGIAALLVLTTMSVIVISTLPAVTVSKIRDLRARPASVPSSTPGDSHDGPRDLAWLPDDHHGAAELTEYLRSCLEPDDRVLFTWYAPDLPYVIQRLPAADHVFILPGFWSSRQRQFRSLGRMREQRVPLVLARANRYPEFQRAFDVLHYYIMEQYDLAGEISPRSSPFRFEVYKDSAVAPTRTYSPHSLPCYR